MRADKAPPRTKRSLSSVESGAEGSDPLADRRQDLASLGSRPCGGSYRLERVEEGHLHLRGDWVLEREMAAGNIGILGEMLFVYAGVHPDDKRMSPYWALAAKDDVPVAVHINRGPPPGVGPRSNPRCCPAFDGGNGQPCPAAPG